jgi:hypothetical protein
MERDLKSLMTRHVSSNLEWKKVKHPLIHYGTDISSNIARASSNDCQNYKCRIARGDLSKLQRGEVSFFQFGMANKTAQTICK